MCSDFCQRESRASVTLGPVSGRPKLALRWFIQPALVLLPSAAAQYDSGGSPPLLYYLRFRGELQETLENFLQSFLKIFQIFLKKVLTF